MRRARIVSCLVTCVVGLAARSGGAEPLRLRGDALAATRAPTGLIVLEAEDARRRWLEAEALVWTALDPAEADALVISARLHDPRGRGTLRVGRFVLTPGALRPVHVDGGSLTARGPSGSAVEVFGGLPVAPSLGPRAYDWLVGSRVSIASDELGSAGLSLLHRRDHGRLADQEVGLDLAGRHAWLDAGARLAYDLIEPGVSDAYASAAARGRRGRVGLYTARRSPSRLLPATSLFAALGSIASDELGVSGSWRAAPRLDLRAQIAVQRAGGDWGGDLWFGATLRLDDRGAGAVFVEGRRHWLLHTGWSGVRGALRAPLSPSWHAGAALELAAPDEPRQRGALWPWALLSLAWVPRGPWEAALAVETHASPEQRAQVNGLVRIGRRWEGP
jgi:hypothetical protein